MSSEENRQNEYRAHLEEMAAAYALGALDDPAERTYFEDLIAARDPLALQLLGEMFDVASGLAHGVPQVDAPSGAEASLIKKLYHVPKSPEKSVPVPQQPKPGGIATSMADKPAAAPERRAYVPMKLKPYIIGGSALVLMLVIAFSVRLLNQRGPDEQTIVHLHQLTRERDSLRHHLAARSHEDTVMHAVVKMLNERTARMVTLEKSQQKNIQQHLFFSPDQKMVVFMDEELPPLPPNKTYQLWQITEGQTMSVGVINKSSEQELYDFKAPHTKAEGFAVTLEEKGGSLEPKGPVLFAGVVPQQNK